MRSEFENKNPRKNKAHCCVTGVTVCHRLSPVASSRPALPLSASSREHVPRPAVHLQLTHILPVRQPLPAWQHSGLMPSSVRYPWPGFLLLCVLRRQLSYLLTNSAGVFVLFYLSPVALSHPACYAPSEPCTLHSSAGSFAEYRHMSSSVTYVLITPACGIYLVRLDTTCVW